MYCELPAENDIIDFGHIEYSDTFDPEYLNFTHIDTTYWVECDEGYLYPDEKNISCQTRPDLMDDPQWAENITTCGKYVGRGPKSGGSD